MPTSIKKNKKQNKKKKQKTNSMRNYKVEKGVDGNVIIGLIYMLQFNGQPSKYGGENSGAHP